MKKLVISIALSTALSTALSIGLPLSQVHADNQTVNQLMQRYATQGASTGSAEQGRQLWLKPFNPKGESKQRSCSSCHGEDLTASGRHIKTRKPIEAMSPAVNSQRLSDARKIEKWFKRNCKWTFGRECSPQEKTNFLMYIANISQF